MATTTPGWTTEISEALRTCRSAFVSTAGFSFVINLLMLTGPLFMLQVYDRVLSSGSLPTLVALVMLVLVLYGLYGFLEMIRARILMRIGRVVDERLRDRVFDVVSHHALQRTANVKNHPTQDLMTVRRFVSSSGPFAFLDIPWTPIYLGVIFLMHWKLGLAALIAVIVLGCVAIANDALTRKPLHDAQIAARHAQSMGDESRRNVEVARALGMLHVLRRRWADVQATALDHQTSAADRASLVTSTSRTLRLMFQSGILAIGAYLAVLQQISPGTMVAASIIMSRALSPVELMVGNWQNFLEFKRAFGRLNKILDATPAAPERMSLPQPTGQISVENLTAYIPGVERPIVERIAFDLQPGAGLGIIGPTGAGKTTVARALVGIWPHMTGHVRLDGASLGQWPPADLGRAIGYLPQEVELFDGTLGDNISRFMPDPDPQAIVRAAQQAAVHDLILGFPDGYNTKIGEAGVRLSAGQRQRIGLARALYGDPVVMVLDEPNANLDADGETALIRAIRDARARGGTVIVVAHRPSAIAALDTLMVLKHGKSIAYGPKEEVLEQVIAKQNHKQSVGGRLTPTMTGVVVT